MRKLGMVLVALASLSLLFSAPALAMNWSIGGNLGYELLIPSDKDVDNLNLFGWPSMNTFGYPYSVPAGFRVGFAGDKPQHEVCLLLAMSVTAGGGDSWSTYGITGNYQYNFVSKGPTTPFVTAGLGFQGFSASGEGSESAGSFLFGGGVGLSRKVGAQGRIRAEARYDRNTKGEKGGDVYIPEASHISLRLGFDLWGK